jgi:hypothetical protein
MGLAKLHGLIVEKTKTDLTSDGKPLRPVLNVTIGAAQSRPLLDVAPGEDLGPWR